MIRINNVTDNPNAVTDDPNKGIDNRGKGPDLALVARILALRRYLVQEFSAVWRLMADVASRNRKEVQDVGILLMVPSACRAWERLFSFGRTCGCACACVCVCV
jgi:hypothetical protein